jgi:thiol:disulfide interchange protein
MNVVVHLLRHGAPVLIAMLASLWAVSANAALPGSVNRLVVTDQVRAELIAHAPDGVKPGGRIWAGLKLSHQPHWHTYWKNSGDSGQATTLEWTLPSGVLAGDIAWPTPHTLRLGSLVNYGYEDTVVLAVPLDISPDFKPSPLAPQLTLGLNAAWLVCKTECLPQEGQFELQLPTNSSTALYAADFQQHQLSLPQALATRSSVRIVGQQLQFDIDGLPEALRGQQLDLYPEIADVIETSAPWTQSWQGARWQALVPINQYRAASPTALPVVVAGLVQNRRQGFALQTSVQGEWPAVKAAGAAAPAPAPALAAPPASAVSASVWLAIAGAFLGGMILNLMPCVFPVLAIKVVGFTRKPSATHSHRVQGLGYSAGVVLSFMALGGLMLALRGAGAQLGWGFQLQSPAVVAGLAVLFTLIGLNLAGVFEFSQLLPSGIATLEAKNPVVNAFLSGVLAVLIASPCTAPFMGASLGLALSLPALDGMLIFSSLGLGMALPYLAASWSPAVARLLPRPGAWMNIFRHSMAFPMFGTVVWLLWVLGQQTGIDGAAALMSLLVLLSMLVWALHLRGRARLPLALVTGTFLVLGLLSLGPHVVQLSEPSQANSTERWQAWSADKVQSVLAAQKPVFVDFTAAWCVTCQVNKKTTLSDQQVLADFDARKVTLLRADWTRRDPAITEALRALGRNGVPVYALYAPGKPVRILSELLTPSEVHAALRELAR